MINEKMKKLNWVFDCAMDGKANDMHKSVSRQIIKPDDFLRLIEINLFSLSNSEEKCHYGVKISVYRYTL